MSNALLRAAIITACIYALIFFGVQPSQKFHPDMRRNPCWMHGNAHGAQHQFVEFKGTAVFSLSLGTEGRPRCFAKYSRSVRSMTHLFESNIREFSVCQAIPTAEPLRKVSHQSPRLRPVTDTVQDQSDDTGKATVLYCISVLAKTSIDCSETLTFQKNVFYFNF